ncbi:MAG: hypothetical protein BGO27_04620 [Alphaproteobacteria bacterium 33-17]|nr:MAG: hypothetical protein BGO27_04620 [Alphaproteobacteria bacterium 33-17]
MSKDKNNPNNKNELDDEFENPEVERGLSSVAAMPGKNIAIIVVFVVMMGFISYNFFFSSPEPKNTKDMPKIEDVKAVSPPPVDVSKSTLPSVPAMPEAPRVIEPEPIVVAPAVPELPRAEPIALPIVPEIPAVSQPRIETNNEQLQQRRKSAIMLGGGGASETPEESKKKEQLRLASQVITPDFSPTKTSAEQVKASRIGETDYTVAQGKIIDAILETAINTDMKGYIRGVVSRDVYGESGRAIMIPKGSRLVGNYSAEIKRGQKRVTIVWSRIIRPDGVDIMVDSPGIDQIGRAGAEGFVDNKYFEVMSNAILLSVITYAVSYQAEQYTNQQQTQGQTQTITTTNPTTGEVTQTTIQPEKTIGQKSLYDSQQNINDAAKNIAKGSLDERPTITVDQGTRIKVFVKKDLLFPKNKSLIKKY